MLLPIDWHMFAREASTTPDSSRLQTFRHLGDCLRSESSCCMSWHTCCIQASCIWMVFSYKASTARALTWSTPRQERRTRIGLEHLKIVINYDSWRHFVRTRGFFWISVSGLWTCPRCPKKRISRFRCQIRVYYTFPFFNFALGFLRRSSLTDEAEQASQKMLSWLRAATWAVDEHVSLRLFGTCMSCTHQRHLTSGHCSAYRCAELRPPVRWRLCVLDMHGPNRLKGGPEPSNFEDLCLVNVSVKYFRKLCFGTSKIQLNWNIWKPFLKSSPFYFSG